jgi:hypothetical protein
MSMLNVGNKKNFICNYRLASNNLKPEMMHPAHAGSHENNGLIIFCYFK